MNSKLPSIRGFGQRSISSSFMFHSLNGSKESKEDLETKLSRKNSRISLSDFLDRKVNRVSIPVKTVQAKQRPFSSLVGGGDTAGSIREQNGSLDEAVFEQFKHVRKEKDDYDGSSGGDGVGESSRTNEQESRKRRNPFEVSFKGGDERHNTPRHLVILGDDPKPKKKWRRQGESFIMEKKPRTLFNYYANGSGWWDCNMEGIDSEEVGCNEVWEGMGSTTLGGLEWH